MNIRYIYTIYTYMHARIRHTVMLNVCMCMYVHAHAGMRVCAFMRVCVFVRVCVCAHATSAEVEQYVHELDQVQPVQLC